MEESEAAALPDDVVVEVLTRVADVAALFRCALACTRFRGLIADRSFLRRRWPENATHPSFLVGFFTQRRRCHGSEDDQEDCNSPPVFIPATRSVLGPGFRSLPAGLLDGAKPLTARRGLLLVRLAAPVADCDVPLHLAVCDLLAGTCDVLPPLQCDRQPVPASYAILTGEDCRSSDGQKPRPPAPGYSTFFKVLAIGFVRKTYHSDVEYSLRTFSSAEPRWAAPAKRSGEDRRCCGPEYSSLAVQDDAVVCRRGIAHWLCRQWWSDPSDSSHCFTIGVSPEDGQVSLANLSFLPIQPNAEIYHHQLATTVDGTLSLFLLYTLEEGLWLDTWTRRDGACWYRARVMELKPPEKKRLRIDAVLYLWSGEKSGTLLITDSYSGCKYVAYLDTGEMEEVSSQFHGMVTDAVPMEIDWPDLFMSRLTRGGLTDNCSMM